MSLGTIGVGGDRGNGNLGDLDDLADLAMGRGYVRRGPEKSTAVVLPPLIRMPTRSPGAGR